MLAECGLFITVDFLLIVLIVLGSNARQALTALVKVMVVMPTVYTQREASLKT